MVYMSVVCGVAWVVRQHRDGSRSGCGRQWRHVIGARGAGAGELLKLKVVVWPHYRGLSPFLEVFMRRKIEEIVMRGDDRT